MDRFFKPFALAAGVFAMSCLADIPEAMFSVSFVREAKAVVVVRGVAPVARVATAAVVTTAVVASSSAQANAAAQANATAQANAAAQANANAAAQANADAAKANQAAAQANKAAAEAKAAAPAQPAVGSIVTTLPAGCTQTKLNNADYMRCGSTYYKPTMAGDAVVFVVAQP